MLQQIHDRAKGWFAWVIIILISIPFALWGIQSYVGGGAEPVAALVNGQEITERDLDQRVQNARIQLRERLGATYDPAQFDDKRLRLEVLDEMIRETLLTDVAARMGLRVSDQELRGRILAEPAFQRDGRFDAASYEQVLKYQGLSPAMFEAQQRREIVGTQLIRAVAGSELVTQTEREQYQRLVGQQRELAWLRVPVSRFLTDEPIDDQAISAYYEANAARFEVPEQVKLDYLVLDAAALAGRTTVAEEDIRRVYDANQARFGQPERRRVRHILLTVPPDADAAAAAAVLAEIEGVRKRLADGEAFDVVAKAVSKDPGSASQGGSLGEIEKGIMDPAFEQSAFALPVGEVSEPVRSRFGYHLIEVESITPAAVKPFAEVQEQLRGEVAKQKAEALFYDLGERLPNLVYETSDSLAPAAKELGLEVQQSDWVGRKGGEGILGHPKVTAAAFSEEVLTERRNSDLIEPEKEVLQTVVLRVVDHREASARPLAEVRDEIAADLRKERAKKAAAAEAASGAEKLRGGADWAAVAGDTKVEEGGLIGRTDPKVPAQVRTLAFTLPVPPAGGASVGTATLEDGDAAIVRITKVEDGKVEPAPKPGTPDPAAMLGQLMGRQAYDAVIKDMLQRAKIERKTVKAREG
ncbi:SurA N-terminal domain-containing protein [Candidatus Thiodictyon syntrophicum]|jgi:peptidyl-prolyl cis-trans isomerase D|uniref:Periplasmic chaperone PpiD n=1 Tax=Candidatus Thiodictyon syntrophicum TaxID=1166950 RepID=A0A2K8UAK7_9GAMM|nr:SurA N-terminal domain-containing protein [Candidatus Thiodictyon syntrophicum]AUB82606.1 peptidylprolyl isomerase [Candidatus Thiodictyon syntrophicum]